MKTILSILLLFSFSISNYAQSSGPQSRVALHTVAEVQTSPKGNLKAKHSQLAANQLRDFLSSNLDYSEISRTLNVEGKAIVEIGLSKRGEIIQSKIIDSPNPQIDTMIKEALKKFTTINTRKRPYAGANRIRIPISFSLR